MSVKPINSHNKIKQGKTNWHKVKSMSENEIVKAAQADPDAHISSKEELKKFKRVSPVKEINIKEIRVRLHLSQQEFAHYFGVSVRTIQEWEQHRREPSASARNFLKVIEYAPKVVQKALAQD